MITANSFTKLDQLGGYSARCGSPDEKIQPLPRTNRIAGFVEIRPFTSWRKGKMPSSRAPKIVLCKFRAKIRCCLFITTVLESLRQTSPCPNVFAFYVLESPRPWVPAPRISESSRPRVHCPRVSLCFKSPSPTSPSHYSHSQYSRPWPILTNEHAYQYKCIKRDRKRVS